MDSELDLSEFRCLNEDCPMRTVRLQTLPYSG